MSQPRQIRTPRYTPTYHFFVDAKSKLFIKKIFPIHTHSFPLHLRGNEDKKQHSPTKTNTNPYKTFTIHTYQCIHCDCTQMVPQNTSHGLEQNNKEIGRASC